MLRRGPTAGVPGRPHLHIRMHLLSGLRGWAFQGYLPKLRWRIGAPADPPGKPFGKTSSIHRTGAKGSPRLRRTPSISLAIRISDRRSGSPPGTRYCRKVMFQRSWNLSEVNGRYGSRADEMTVRQNVCFGRRLCENAGSVESSFARIP